MRHHDTKIDRGWHSEQWSYRWRDCKEARTIFLSVIEFPHQSRSHQPRRDCSCSSSGCVSSETWLAQSFWGHLLCTITVGHQTHCWSAGRMTWNSWTPTRSHCSASGVCEATCRVNRPWATSSGGGDESASVAVGAACQISLGFWIQMLQLCLCPAQVDRQPHHWHEWFPFS